MVSQTLRLDSESWRPSPLTWIEYRNFFQTTPAGAGTGWPRRGSSPNPFRTDFHRAARLIGI